MPTDEKQKLVKNLKTAGRKRCPHAIHLGLHDAGVGIHSDVQVRRERVDGARRIAAALLILEQRPAVEHEPGTRKRSY